MVLTLFGGCVYPFFGIFVTYAFLAAISSPAGGSVVYGSDRALYGSLMSAMISLIVGVLIIVGGFYLSSDVRAHRLQGAGLAIASSIAGLVVVLALPFLAQSPQDSFYSAFGLSMTLFVIEFIGFVFTLIGASLGITYKSQAQGYLGS
jgi:hypothetical protein